MGFPCPSKVHLMFYFLLILLLFVIQETTGFILVPIHVAPSAYRLRNTNDQSSLTTTSAQKGNNFVGDPFQLLQARIEEQKRSSLVEAVLNQPDGLTLVHIVGQANLPTTVTAAGKNQNVTCAVLSARSRDELQQQQVVDPLPCLLLPLDNNAQLKLLSFAVHKKQLSKSVMLGLNSLMVNRDNGLFDNLPWSRWSVDPQQRNRDAAGNDVAQRFHLGKRDAYNRFMGKDWQGKSLAIGNLALRLKYFLEENDNDDLEIDDDDDDDDDQISLAKRILELQIREQEMDVAEFDYIIAVSRQNSPQDLDILLSQRQACLDKMEATQRTLEELLNNSNEDNGKASGSAWVVSFLTNLLQDVADWTTDYGANAAPYRGAMGYAPLLDSKTDIGESLMTYTSPYDLMEEILRDQLNAEVIGGVLENTSLLRGNLAVGGAIILRRITATKSVTIAGERLSLNDEDEEYGNQGIKGGETFLVECDSDEAIGMALACQVPLRIESNIWHRASVMSQPFDATVSFEKKASETVRSALPFWKAIDPELSILVEGQAGNRSATERVAPLRVPRSTTSLFDTLFDPSTKSDSSRELFPVDNPIQSIAQYDAMSNEDKAVTLMTISNFNGRLPRPRAVRKSESSGDRVNALDKLLVPLIDESVRREYLIRDAERRGDTAEAEELKRGKSKRQVAKEKAEQARELGEVDVAEWWEREAEMYKNLRADVTQDEGSYSRFLDRDEWYERTRAQQAKKLDKKKFGTLLDGME